MAQNNGAFAVARCLAECVLSALTQDLESLDQLRFLLSVTGKSNGKDRDGTLQTPRASALPEMAATASAFYMAGGLISCEADPSEGSIARGAALCVNQLLASVEQPVQRPRNTDSPPTRLVSASLPQLPVSSHHVFELQQEIEALRMQLVERDQQIEALQEEQLDSNGTLSTPGPRPTPPPSAPVSPGAPGATPGAYSLANPLFQDSPSTAGRLEPQLGQRTPLAALHHTMNPDGTPGPSFSMRKNDLFDEQVGGLPCIVVDVSWSLFVLDSFASVCDEFLML